MSEKVQKRLDWIINVSADTRNLAIFGKDAKKVGEQLGYLERMSAKYSLVQKQLANTSKEDISTIRALQKSLQGYAGQVSQSITKLERLTGIRRDELEIILYAEAKHRRAALLRAAEAAGIEKTSLALGRQKKGVKDASAITDSYTRTVDAIRGRTEGWRHALGKLRNTLLLVTFATSSLKYAFLDSVRAAKESESALLGLSSVARNLGSNVTMAKNAAVELTQDGLLTIKEASAGLKNLLSAGFGLKESIDLMKAFKDSAAFNRQGTLEFGEAIIGATQGLKNQQCLAWYTEVYDPVRGETKSIEDWHEEGIVPCVLSVNRQTGEMEVIQAEYLHYNGEREVYEIELENGKTIDATTNHRFLTQEGFKFLSDLDLENDVLYYVDEEEVDESLKLAGEITKNNTSMLENNKNLCYINKNNKEDYIWQRNSVDSVVSPSGLTNQNFVPKNVVGSGTRPLIESKKNQRGVLTAEKSSLAKAPKDFALLNVLETTTSKNYPSNLEYAHSVGSNLSEISGNQNTALWPVILNHLLIERSKAGKENSVYTVEQNLSLEAKKELKLNSAHQSVGLNIPLSIYSGSVKSVVSNTRLLEKAEGGLENQGSAQKSAQLNTMQDTEVKLLNQKLLHGLKLNAKSAEKLLNLIESWSREDLDEFVQKNVDPKLLVNNSVEKIALVILNTLRRHVINVEKSLRVRQAKLTEAKDFVQKSVKIKHTLGRSQESTTPTINMGTERLQGDYALKQNINSTDWKYFKEIPFDVYDAVELLKVILTYTIFSEAENIPTDTFLKRMDSLFVKSATEKSINSLNLLLKNILNITPTPMRIRKITLAGLERTYDLTVPEQFNYLAASFVCHNSILVDNVGVTKNLSVMYKEYAASVGTTMGRLTEAQKRQAAYVGVLKEAEAFSGDAARVTGTLGGAMAKLSVNVFNAQAAIGQKLDPAMRELIRNAAEVVHQIKKWADANGTLVSRQVLIFLDNIKTTAAPIVAIFRGINFAGERLKGVLGDLTSSFLVAAVAVKGYSKIKERLLKITADGTKAFLKVNWALTAAVAVVTALVWAYNRLAQAKQRALDADMDEKKTLAETAALRREAIEVALEYTKLALDQAKANKASSKSMEELAFNVAILSDKLEFSKFEEFEAKFKALGSELNATFERTGGIITNINRELRGGAFGQLIVKDVKEAVPAFDEFYSSLFKTFKLVSSGSKDIAAYSKLLSELTTVYDSLQKNEKISINDRERLRKQFEQISPKLASYLQLLRDMFEAQRGGGGQEDIVVDATETANALKRLSKMLDQIKEKTELARGQQDEYAQKLIRARHEAEDFTDQLAELEKYLPVEKIKATKTAIDEMAKAMEAQIKQERINETTAAYSDLLSDITAKMDEATFANDDYKRGLNGIDKTMIDLTARLEKLKLTKGIEGNEETIKTVEATLASLRETLTSSLEAQVNSFDAFQQKINEASRDYLTFKKIAAQAGVEVAPQVLAASLDALNSRIMEISQTFKGAFIDQMMKGGKLSTEEATVAFNKFVESMKSANEVAILELTTVEASMKRIEEATKRATLERQNKIIIRNEVINQRARELEAIENVANREWELRKRNGDFATHQMDALLNLHQNLYSRVEKITTSFFDKEKRQRLTLGKIGKSVALELAATEIDVVKNILLAKAKWWAAEALAAAASLNFASAAKYAAAAAAAGIGAGVVGGIASGIRSKADAALDAEDTVSGGASGGSSREGGRTVATTVQAPEMTIYISPTVTISGDNIFIGSGSVEEFEDAVGQVTVKAVQGAIDEGSISLTQFGK